MRFLTDVVWLACAIIFIVILSDLIFYVSVAVVAIVREHLFPEPGFPAFRRKKTLQNSSNKSAASAYPAPKIGSSIKAKSSSPDLIKAEHSLVSSLTDSSTASSTASSTTGTECQLSEQVLNLHQRGSSGEDRLSQSPPVPIGNNGILSGNLEMSPTDTVSEASVESLDNASSAGPPCHIAVLIKGDPSAKGAPADVLLPASQPFDRSDSFSSIPLSTDVKIDAIDPALAEQYLGGYPLVVVQAPMYNEESHCVRVVEDMCQLQWPRDKLIIQVNDDSTRKDLSNLIDATAARMCLAGHQVMVCRRPNRDGFKAGALVSGLDQLPTGTKYCAIFDADFKPPVDFLYQTIYHLEKDKSLAFVQGRWLHANKWKNLLTWYQALSLDFHFAIEQRARGFLRTFYGFNGTAGVWRLDAINQSGGWHIDTTVEDMDLSARAFANGWKFKYLHHVGSVSELPETLPAYRGQQYRWLSGPMQVIKKSIGLTWRSDTIGVWSKMSATYFFIRYIISGCIPLVAMVVPPLLLTCPLWTTWTWTWPQIAFIAITNAYCVIIMPFAGWLGPLAMPVYVLCASTTGAFRIYAMWCGMVGSKKSKTWKVTAKVGGGSATGLQELAMPATQSEVENEEGALKLPATAHPDPVTAPADPIMGSASTGTPGPATAVKKKKKDKGFFRGRPYLVEAACFLFFGAMAAYAGMGAMWVLTGYCGIMAVAFAVLSLGGAMPIFGM